MIIKPVPMMDPPEIEAMRALITERQPKRVLEWGAGGSTLYWPAEFPEIEWVSVEHNPDYAAAIQDRLPANVSLRCLDFPAYYQVGGQFDLIIVDGRERVRCLDAARRVLAPGGAVVLHDAGRARYAPAKDYYRSVTVLVDPKPGKDPRGLWLLEDPIEPAPCPEATAPRGVIYMCWGEPATLQAEASMQSLWQHEPGMPVLVVGDGEAVRYFYGRDHVIACEVDVDPFSGEHLFGFKAGRIKPLLARLSPFEQSLYVDAETEFKRSPAEGFDLLEKWDFVIAEAETRSLAATFPDNRTEAGETAEWLGTPHILYHNSGMIFWRKNEATTRLFDLWSSEWQRYQGWDEQIALLRALLKSDVLFLNVPFTWNCRGPEGAHLLHHRFASRAARKFRNLHHTGANSRRGVPAEPKRPLVTVELEPGRFVKVHEGDEERVREHFERMKGSRMAIITSPENWPVDSQEVRMKKGPLVKVEIRPGQFVKMYEADAIKAGHLKAREQPQNKMQQPAENKAPEPEQAPEQPADDFTTIPGVGKAAARALAAHGVATFDDLRAAGELDYLSEKVNQAIAEWRNG